MRRHVEAVEVYERVVAAHNADAERNERRLDERRERNGGTEVISPRSAVRLPRIKPGEPVYEQIWRLPGDLRRAFDPRVLYKTVKITHDDRITPVRPVIVEDAVHTIHGRRLHGRHRVGYIEDADSFDDHVIPFSELHQWVDDLDCWEQQ